MDTQETQIEQISDEVGTEPTGDGATTTPSPATPRLTLKEIQSLTAEELRPYFKDVRNCWRTVNLFEETCEDPAKYPPIFSLKDEDTASCVSLKRLYLLIEDVTEYKFAQLTLGGWEHWKMITESFKLKPYIAEWREHLDLQLRQKYIQQISEVATGDGPVALQANKYLLETVTGHKQPLRGRPSKKEKEEAIKREMRDSDEIKRDMERLGIKVAK
jgi:hypothetical protein